MLRTTISFNPQSPEDLRDLINSLQLQLDTVELELEHGGRSVLRDEPSEPQYRAPPAPVVPQARPVDEEAPSPPSDAPPWIVSVSNGRTAVPSVDRYALVRYDILAAVEDGPVVAKEIKLALSNKYECCVQTVAECAKKLSDDGLLEILVCSGRQGRPRVWRKVGDTSVVPELESKVKTGAGQSQRVRATEAERATLIEGLRKLLRQNGGLTADQMIQMARALECWPLPWKPTSSDKFRKLLREGVGAEPIPTDRIGKTIWKLKEA